MEGSPRGQQVVETPKSRFQKFPLIRTFLKPLEGHNGRDGAQSSAPGLSPGSRPLTVTGTSEYPGVNPKPLELNLDFSGNAVRPGQGDKPNGERESVVSNTDQTGSKPVEVYSKPPETSRQQATTADDQPSAHSEPVTDAKVVQLPKKRKGGRARRAAEAIAAATLTAAAVAACSTHSTEPFPTPTTSAAASVSPTAAASPSVEGPVAQPSIRTTKSQLNDLITNAEDFFRTGQEFNAQVTYPDLKINPNTLQPVQVIEHPGENLSSEQRYLGTIFTKDHISRDGHHNPTAPIAILVVKKSDATNIEEVESGEKPALVMTGYEVQIVNGSTDVPAFQVISTTFNLLPTK